MWTKEPPISARLNKLQRDCDICLKQNTLKMGYLASVAESDFFSGYGFATGAPSGSVYLTGPPNNSIYRVTATRSEEHTSELQSPYDLVCRLLLEKKKKKQKINT